jgi:hypothetical protein
VCVGRQLLHNVGVDVVPEHLLIDVAMRIRCRVALEENLIGARHPAFANAISDIANRRGVRHGVRRGAHVFPIIYAGAGVVTHRDRNVTRIALGGFGQDRGVARTNRAGKEADFPDAVGHGRKRSAGVGRDGWLTRHVARVDELRDNLTAARGKCPLGPMTPVGLKGRRGIDQFVVAGRRREQAGVKVDTTYPSVALPVGPAEA